MNTFYTYFDRGKPETIVFVYGMLVDSTIWDLQVDYFKDKFNILTYDLRGHGRTGPSELDRYTISTYADDLSQLAKKLGISQAHFVGISFGGMILQKFALDHASPESKNPSDLIQSLTLIGTFADSDGRMHERLLKRTLLRKQIYHPLIKLIGAKATMGVLGILLPFFAGTKWLSSEKYAELYKLSAPINTQELIKIFDCAYDFESLEGLEELKLPILLVRGEHDAPSKPQHELLKETFSGEKVAILPKTGHAAVIEQADLFNNLLEKFIHDRG